MRACKNKKPNLHQTSRFITTEYGFSYDNRPSKLIVVMTHIMLMSNYDKHHIWKMDEAPNISFYLKMDKTTKLYFMDGS
jgi:hypothetical protein